MNTESQNYWMGQRVITKTELEESFWDGWSVPSIINNNSVSETRNLGNDLPIDLQ